jgi:basic amino acid/polyamine antiporter, APA family
LAYVSFSYSGWNASAYLTSEIENPKVNVPKSLFWGTFIVMMIYVSLNFVFLFTASTESMKGQLEVGYISASVFLGNIGGKVMAGMIALLLISSISAMIFAGPRVTQVMGEDLALLKPLAYKNANGVPLYAIILQTTISIILILTASFQTVLNAIAFTLDIFTFSTVLGVFVMRFREPNAERVYKTWGYPFTPLIFLVATAWTMYFIFNLYPIPSLIAIGIVLLGLIIYFADRSFNKRK